MSEFGGKFSEEFGRQVNEMVQEMRSNRENRHQFGSLVPVEGTTVFVTNPGLVGGESVGIDLAHGDVDSVRLDAATGIEPNGSVPDSTYKYGYSRLLEAFFAYATEKEGNNQDALAVIGESLQATAPPEPVAFQVR